MAEEKKDVTPETKPAETAAPKVEAKPEAPAQAQPQAEAPAAPAQAAAVPAPAKPEEKAQQPIKVKPENCASCKKSIRKKRWYYRAGSFYCNKRCWMTANKKSEKPAEAAGAETK